ncbi:hypothetical protein F5X68DRAFT_165330 [Plectosphaerella plurivora]|uniref:Fermentation associated protein n=1 Tax=Plectosphaerella plurivora TaxID=936078 RepID=A0A9P8VJH5_9PEZI|nr:hypothetical protein F5X68DRAFT_165330 [Plectosphaerella plurivora]
MSEGTANPNTSGTNDGPVFDGVFLAYLIVCAFLAIFFLLYFNRLLGYIVSLGIRTWAWHQYRIHIRVQALQVSLLGGRVFFTGLRYHGNNEAFHVQHGYITWRYWIWRVRDVDIKSSAKAQRGRDEQGSPTKATGKPELPCRITVTLAGLEWFVYNRSAVYDGILAGLTDETPSEGVSAVPVPSAEGEASMRNRGRGSKEKPADESSGTGNGRSSEDHTLPGRLQKLAQGLRPRASTSRTSIASETGPSTASTTPTADLPFMLQAFPIYITCQKAAMVMGNENTKGILVVKADSLTGEIDASASTTCDPYRQVFTIKFQHPVIEMKDNEDYKEDQVSRASRDDTSSQLPLTKRNLFRRHKRKTLGGLRNLVPWWRKSVESFFIDPDRAHAAQLPPVRTDDQWQGLARYLDDNERDVKMIWANVEYAAIPTVVDSPEATLVVYWDVPGKVTADAFGQGSEGGINGSEAPGWGINLSVNGGIANYGPWADRLRADIQRVFFPGLSKSATPAKNLQVGSDRVPTQFKLFVELLDDLTLRIPTREDSKNWRWKGREPSTKPEPREHLTRKQRARAQKHNKGDNAPLRPSGWLDFKITSNATISYCMDMLAGPQGYAIKLDLDLPSTELSSSVNHELLWRSGQQRISCDLSTPLKWNGMRSWHFNITSSRLELFLLRDHIFLLTDLIEDWGSGPPVDYLVFTPFRYYLNLELRVFKLYLNVNDSNIINKPTDFEDNTYLVAASPALMASVCIPIDKYRPPKNAVSFDLKADSFGLDLHIPPWNTQASFLSTTTIGTGENVAIKGSYNYNATTSPANTDTLIIDVSGQSVAATVFGFIVRYVLKLKDNYFGDDVHFKTLDEYRDTLALKERNPALEQANRQPSKKSNDMDVVLGLRVDDVRVLLPANLYTASRNLQIETASLALDLRFTNYYMDLDLLVAPLGISLGSADMGPETPMSATSSTQLFIDGLKIYGHRLFGLPPTEPTYMCNWDINIGALTGECTADCLATLARAGRAFGFEFDDDENALIPASALIVYDVTFLRVAVQSVKLWLHVDEAAFMLSTATIDVKFNDWARTHYSKRANIHIPDLQISCVNSELASRQRFKAQSEVEADALVKTSIHVAFVGRKYHFSQERKLQQELIRREDQRTHRTDFLLVPNIPLDDFVPEAVDPPAQDPPPVPHPADALDGVSDLDDLSERFSVHRELRRKSSFLSTTTASSATSSSSIRHIGGMRGSRLSTGHERSINSARNSRAFTPTGSGRPHTRDVSVSTGRLSASYRVLQEQNAPEYQTSMSFASQFFPPYFPLEQAQPRVAGSKIPSIEADGEEDEEFLSFGLDDIDPDALSENHAYSGVVIELPAGVTACLNPTSVRSVSALIAALQPSEPEDVLDSLHVSSMTDIFDQQKIENISGQISDLCLRIPRASVRFFGSASTIPDNSQEEQDQYDISLGGLVLSTRSTESIGPTTSNGTPSLPQKKMAVMARLASADLSASERSYGGNRAHTAVQVHVDRLMLSIGTRDVTYIDGEIEAIRGSTASGNIEYLASLVHRTGVMASDLGGLLEETLARHDRRVKNFINTLLLEGENVSDPMFLVRPSAVLRTADRHLRTYDAWKLSVRLRQIWASLPAQTRETLSDDLLHRSRPVSPTARKQIVAAFARWRNWDLADIDDSPLIKNIFGPSEKAEQESPSLPLLAALRLRETQFILDPGPKQNRIFFSDLTLRAEKKAGDGVRSPPGVPGQDATDLAIINIYCNEAAINLNWELCELAADILRLSEQSGTRDSPPEPKQKETTPGTQKRKGGLSYHVVTVLRRGSIEVDTINLSAKSLAHDLQASLLTGSSGQNSTSLDFILSCEAVTSRLHHHSENLGIFQLRKPSVIFSHQLQQLETVSCHTIKTTASSHSLSLAVKQDPIGLLEVADVLVKDELAQLIQLKNRLPLSSNKPKTTIENKSLSHRLSTYRVNVALFLDEYNISLPLLQSLTYNISGVVARAAVAANFGRELIFDFDIKENSHEMQIVVKNKPRTISLLRIPPTNGRITSRMSASEHSISVFASVELIQLDASAVYSLLRALNRPQISNALEEVQEQTSAIQEHIKDIFGSDADPGEQPNSVSSPQPPATPAARLVYTVHGTLAGLEVFGKTPLQSHQDQSAYISFALDRVHLEVANRHEQHGPILAQPELHVNLSQILFDIQKGTEGSMRSCGSIALGALISASTRVTKTGKEERSFNFRSDGLDIQLSPETTSTVVAVLGYLGDKIKDLDTSRELEYLRKIRQTRPRIALNDEEPAEETDLIDSFLSSLVYQFEIRDTQISWFVGDEIKGKTEDKEDLVLSIQLISLGTRQTGSARLSIDNFQLQMVPYGQDPKIRSLHSALLPEVVFNIAYVSTATARRLAFQAVGKPLDLRLTSGFIIPAANLSESINLSIRNVQQATEHWTTGTAPAPEPEETKPDSSDSGPSSARKSILGTKRVENLLIDADFAGAVVHISGKRSATSIRGIPRNSGTSTAGKYGQFKSDDPGSGTVLRSPGLACKVEYRDNGEEDPSLYGEIKVDASSNTLYPSVVPLVMEMTAAVKEVVSDENRSKEASVSPLEVSKPKIGAEDNILTADPNAPIARVAATAFFDDIYFTANTVRSVEQGNFFAISAAFTKLQASVQHVYSRESTGSFDVNSIVLSFMNSKHVSGTSGVSAILKFSPMSITINAKQLQDFLLFHEIWYPKELRQGSAAPVAKLNTETSQGHLVQRYQQVAATAAFPWTATISMESLDVSLDMGQAIGKSVFAINNFWVSSKKTSDWQQNLTLGFDKIGIDCTGRLSGFVALQQFQLRTSIQWPQREAALNETPLIQASIGFSHLRLKAAFDYQAFLVADITTLEFLMYNVRSQLEGAGDRLVAIFDGEAVQIFGTTSSAALGVALYQAVQKLIQERKASFEMSLKEIEKFMKRKSQATVPSPQAPTAPKIPEEDTLTKSPISLDTDAPKTLSEISVEDVVSRATGSRGGTILKVPRVEAIMQTWQKPNSNHIDYIFKSAFEGKVEVGWNYSRVSYIRGMFAKHSKQLEQVWGKELPLSAIKVTGVPEAEGGDGDGRPQQQKITAEVNVPQSKYEYVALEPPKIETPQLRDMGEATPPLEWIGLNRDKMPNLTHQIVIVSLLELAGEVEDAYVRIMGSS